MDEAQQYCIDTHAVDAHEHDASRVRQNENDNRRKNRRSHLGHVGLHFYEDEVANHGCPNRDERLPDEDEGATDAVDEGHSRGVGPQRLEGVLGGSAEALALERNLNVGVAVQELDKTLKAGHAAAQTIYYALYYSVLVAASSLHLLRNVLQHQPDELNDGQNQRAERDRSKVELEHSADTPRNGSVELHSFALRKVPNASRASQYECAHALDKRVDPKPAENIVPQHLLLLLCVLHGSNRIVRVFGNSSH